MSGQRQQQQGTEREARAVALAAETSGRSERSPRGSGGFTTTAARDHDGPIAHDDARVATAVTGAERSKSSGSSSTDQSSSSSSNHTTTSARSLLSPSSASSSQRDRDRPSPFPLPPPYRPRTDQPRSNTLASRRISLSLHSIADDEGYAAHARAASTTGATGLHPPHPAPPPFDPVLPASRTTVLAGSFTQASAGADAGPLSSPLPCPATSSTTAAASSFDSLNASLMSHSIKWGDQRRLMPAGGGVSTLVTPPSRLRGLPTLASPRSPHSSLSVIRSAGEDDECEGNNGGAGCIGGIGRSGVVRSVRRCCCSRWSFTRVFSVLMAVVLVALTAALWATNIAATTHIAHSMADVTRGALMHTITQQFGVRFSCALDSLLMLRWATDSKFPSFPSDRRVSNVTGWLAVLTTTATASPELCAVGLINQHHTFMSLFKRTGSIPADPQQLSHLRVMHAEPGDGGATDGADGADVADGVCRVYSPRTVQPFPDDALRHPRKLRMSTQVRHRDSPALIRDYLGAPIANVSVPGGLVRITQMAGQELRASGLQTMWSEPTMPDNTVTNAFTVTAFSRIEPTATSPEQLDTLGHAPIAFVAIDLASFGDLFARLQPALGASGIGFLITPRGLVVASSQQTYVRHSVFGSLPNDLAPHLAPPDDLLALLQPLLLSCGLVTERAVSNLNATELLTADESAGAVCEHSLHYRGDEFLFQASLLSQSDTALPWSVVLLTRDYDFFGSQIRRATIQMVVIALASMVVAVTLVAVIVRMLTRPIDEVAGFMADVARIASMPASDSKQKDMKDLQQRWRVSDAGAGSQTGASLRVRSTKSPGGGGRRVGDQSALQQAEAQTLDQRQRRIARGSLGGSLSCRTREVSLMQRSFGELLQSWAGYDELEALNHSKRQFIRYIFHEVRVPFNAIVLGVEQLAVDLQPHAALLPDAADTIAILSEQSGVVTHILNDVLSLQKIEDGALTLDCAPFDVDRMVRSTLYSFKAPCKERKLRLKVNLDDLNAMVAVAARAACATWTWPSHLPPLCFGVLGDVHRLRQVSNAIKFSGHGRELRVLLEFSELQLDAALLSLGSHDGGRVPSEADVSALADHPLGQVLMRVTVKDEGAGIPAEHQANLFKPYMQIDAGKLQSSKGSGLGLALCKSVVELHGGSVGFESELGAGSSFFFSLPMQLCLLDAADAPSRSTHSATCSVAAATASALTALQNAEEQTFRALITPHGEGPRSLLMRHSSATAGASDTAPSDCMDALRPAPITVDDSPRDARDDNVADCARAGGSSGHDDNDALSPAWPRTTSSDQGPGNSVHHRTRTELFFAPTSNSSRSSLSPGATSLESRHLAAGMVACSNMLPLRLAHSALLPQGSGAATPLSASASASSSLTSTPILGPGKSGRPGTVIRLQKRFGYITPSLDSRRVGSVAVGSVDSAGPSAVSTPTNAVTAAEAATSTIPAEPSTLPSTPASSSFASFSPSSPRVRVLVVEDSAPNRKLLCALLTRLRCVVTAVENGQLCVDLMRPHFDTPPDAAAPLPFDIVLMDNSMPVMDGVTATRLLREGGIALPVVGVTGNALEEDIRSFMNGGATEILTKPVSTAQLSRVLQQYTHYRPTAAPSRAAPSTPVAGSRRGDAPS